jgi:hypothetical protein
VRTIKPNGAQLARDLTAALGMKDAAHYGTVFLSATSLRSTLRAATRLVDAARDALAS